MLAERLGMPPEDQYHIGDTEARAMRALPLSEGDLLEINGQWAPCEYCKQAMTARASETGADIIYSYRTASGARVRWSAQTGENF